MSNFRADCSRCCGLCCVVPGHVVEQGFPADKPADSACDHLDACHRCSIYAARRHEGYEGCEAFDCYGTGQWVTQQLFNGTHWSQSPDTARSMFAAYRFWLPRFELAALIEAALPHVRDSAKKMLVEWMTGLTSTKPACQSDVSNPAGLRRKILRVIRASLRDEAHARPPYSAKVTPSGR